MISFPPAIKGQELGKGKGTRKGRMRLTITVFRGEGKREKKGKRAVGRSHSSLSMEKKLDSRKERRERKEKDERD